MELDEKNKILFESLLEYARFSVKDLARVLKVTKSAVTKRLKLLEEKGYISRYDAIINWQKLPFVKKVYFITVDKNREEFEELIISQEPVFSLINLSGLYDYQIWCFFKNVKQQKFFEAKIKKFGKKSIKVSKLIFPRVSFFGLPLKLSPPKIKDKRLNLRPIDIKIMKYMAAGHGRESFYQMSNDLKLPYDSVHYHGKNLLRAGYFEKIIAQPGKNKLSLQTTCLLIKCGDKKYAEILYNSLIKVPRVISVAISNDGKVMIHFLSQTHQEYREKLAEILSLIPKKEIGNVIIAYWEKVILNNRYPLEYLLN